MGTAAFADRFCMVVSEELGRRVKSTDYSMRISAGRETKGMTAYR